MKAILKKLKLGFILLGLLFLFLGFMMYWLGFRINTSNSIPLGLYKIAKRPLVKGNYVIFCPPMTALFQEALKRRYLSSGFCPGGLGYLMKQVLAVSSDLVFFDENGVFVNGKLLPKSKPFKADGQDRLLPQLRGKHLLKNAELLFMTDQNPLSFDARYFGLIDKAQVIAVIEPLLTWPFMPSSKGN